MVPTFYLCFFTFVGAALADVISSRTLPSTGAQDLARPNTYKVVPPLAEEGTEQDTELLDIVLLASVDGKFHALNRKSGQTLWSMSSFTSSTTAAAPTALAPLIRTIHHDHDPDLVDDNTDQETYIIEPQSGDIYVMANPSSPLQRFPFSMSELVDMSPFSFADSDDRRVFVGKKETSLLLVELETGRIKATLNSECPWDPFEGFQDDEELDLDELEGSKPKLPSPTEVFIGRTDYHISIYSRPLKNSGLTPPPVQNLSFSTYGPNNQDTLLQASYKRPKDDAYIQGFPNGDIISFKGRGEDTGIRSSSPLWGRQFTSPIVAVFDVLRKPQRYSRGAHTFLLLQPRPGLQDVLPSLSLDTAREHLPNHPNAYVGMVEETGSLFAMSPLSYPLVAFGGIRGTSMPERPGKYIDSAPMSSEVDEITRMRKQMEKERERERLLNKDDCDLENPDTVFDRRCLIGVRKLEGGDGEGAESRLKRLLDGSPVSPYPQLITGEEDNETSRHDKPSEYKGGAPPSSPAPSNSRLWDKVFLVVILGMFSVWFGLSSKIKGDAKGLSSMPAVLEASIKEVTVPDPVAVTETVPTPAMNTPEVVQLPPSSPPPPIQSNGKRAEDAGDTGGDDSDKEPEGEGDATPVPNKRKGRRGGRGKKKRPNPGAHVEVEEGKKPDLVIETPPPQTLVVESKPVEPTPSLVVSETVLGFGSHGTVVFQGSLQGRAVAVKRLLQDFVTLASREVSILQESDDHPHVIRYYYQEAHANFLYIALELCPCSLADIIEHPDRDQLRPIAQAFEPKKALRQITSGLRHLHALKLVHRDIKPHNILISGHGKMLISDFGLCKKLDMDQTSFLPTAHGAMAAGTVGWRAPEILRGEVKLDEIGDDNSISSRGSSRGSTGTATGVPSGSSPTRLTKSVDIFALGCLFYYTLTNGGHPYGDRFEREINILKNEKNLEGLERFGEEGSEAVHLIEQMLNPDSHKRPDTTTCLVHPFFWNPGRRLNFLQDASDRFEVMCRDPKDPDLVALEKDAFSVVGNDWQSRLDKIFIENLGKFRKYDGKSVQDLLRALRNKKHHYQDLPENVKRHLGSMPDGYLSYFTRRYPRLILHVHRIVGETALRTESMFRSYYELSD
ncbi:other/IRE protein kinase [Desarmillaria ectypa]|nr:other/IRE protein kinase [Desarmillaria ectypa]